MVLEKDVIYIDTEDDITAIVGKIKASKVKVLALVPPKRIGVLQSVVNLRLLARVAENSNKKLVIITNNASLKALTALVMIPVAKNLQSKPQLMEAPEGYDVDEVEVINGSELPIGELDRTTPKEMKAVTDEAIEEINLEETNDKEKDGAVPKASKKEIKIPNFQKFRKKIVLGTIAILGLVGFSVWATQLAPTAKVVITTDLTAVPVSLAVKLSETEPTDSIKEVIKTVVKKVEKDLTVDFEATGTQDKGTKASGTVILSTGLANPQIYVAGGKIKIGDKEYLTQSEVIIPGKGQVTVKVVAIEKGESYNQPASKSCEITETGVGVSCSSASEMTGGTTKIINIVTASDVQKASQELVDLPTKHMSDQLAKQFTNNEMVIADSFLVDYKEGVSTPAVGEEVTGKARLVSKATYSLMAIAQPELKTILREVINKQIVKPKSQKIHQDGLEQVKLSNYSKTDQQTTIHLSTVGQIGPNISLNGVRKLVKGKKFGDIQALLSQVEGVDSVEVKFSYFWVNRVPQSDDKIEIELKSKR